MRSSAIAKSALFFSLASLNKSGSGGGGGDSGESVYEYAINNGITTLSQAEFNTAWSNSLNPVPFKDQLLSYLIDIGYNKDTLDQANTQILLLVNGQLKPSESFYDSMKKLVPSMTEPDINVVMTDLLTGKLTSKELYKMLTDKGYTESQETMQSTLYTLFTTEILTPYTYLTNTLNETSVTEEEFNTQYIKLAKGKLDKQDIYNYLLANGMDSSITQATVDSWLIKLVSGDLDGQTPYDYAKILGTTQTKEDFDYQYFTLLCKYLVDGGSANKTAGGDSFPGPWNNDPASNVSLYDMYVNQLGYQGTQEELYSQLQKVAYTLLASGGDSSNDETHTGSNTFPAEIPNIEPHECYVSNVSGGDSSNTDSFGSNDFPGDIPPVVTNDFISYMREIGYNGTDEELNTQMLNLANNVLVGDLSGEADGGDASGTGNQIEEFDYPYTGQVVTSDFEEYMRSAGYTGSSEELEARMLSYAQGTIVGSVDGNNGV